MLYCSNKVTGESPWLVKTKVYFLLMLHVQGSAPNSHSGILVAESITIFLSLRCNTWPQENAHNGSLAGEENFRVCLN